MPHGDRTGPMGGGSRSGRGFGYCSGSDRPGFQTGRPGMGGYRPGFGGGHGGAFGFRGGGGFGSWARRRHRFFARGGYAAEPYGERTKEEELANLREEESWLNDEVQAVNKRIEELGE